LRSLLNSGIVRLFADLAEHPRTLDVGVNKQIEAGRAEFFEAAWRVARASFAFRSRLIGRAPVVLSPPSHCCARPTERVCEQLCVFPLSKHFSGSWTMAARRMLPAPALNLLQRPCGASTCWSALELLSESIDAENPERVRWISLTAPLARAFAKPYGSDLRAKRAGRSRTRQSRVA